MFHSSLLCAALLVTQPAARDVSANGAGLRPSIEAGVTLSTWRQNAAGAKMFPSRTTGHFGTLTGFFAGGSISLPHGPVALRVGLTQSRRGTQIPDDPETVRIYYLDLPVLLELRPWGHDGLRPLLLAGAAASRRLDVSSSQFPGLDLDDFVKSTDVAVVVGAGIERGRIAFEVKYTRGLVDLETHGSGSGRSRNRAWLVGARLRL